MVNDRNLPSGMSTSGQFSIPDVFIDDNVYTGFWTNHALGSFQGATLTVNREVGGLLIAALALFVGAALRSAWKVMRFLLYTACADPLPQDGLHHQRQVILRNNFLAIDTGISLLRANWVWRNRATAVQFKTLPIAVAALAVSLSAVAAGNLRQT